MCSMWLIWASGFTGAMPANRGGISIMALLIIMATGFKSWAWAFSPRRWASRGMAPPPAKGSSNSGGFPLVDFRISALAASSTRSLLEFSQTTKSSRMRNSRCRSRFCSSSVGNFSGWEEGSSTRLDQITARAAANGRRAHQRCRVDGCPWRMDFSRADSALIFSRGSATSISFFVAILPTLHYPFTSNQP